jgi:hypothetical protein
VIESLGSDEKGRYVRPGATIKIDPKYLQNKHISDIFAVINPPPLPPSIVQAEELMEKIQTQLSGNVAVLRGEDLGSQASGKKVETLQDAAINQVNTGDETELCLQRLAMLMQHAHVHFATVEQVERYYRKLPRSVLEAIHVDIAPTLNWEARVSVASGGGQLKTRKRQQAMIDLATIDAYSGKPVIDIQTAREEADIDHEEVEDRLAAQMLERAATEAQQPQDEENPKKKEKEPANVG